MDPDLAFVIGLIVGVFSIPAIVSAISEHRAPRVAAIAVIISGGLMAWAIMHKPSGYRVDQIPDVIVKVVARYIK